MYNHTDDQIFQNFLRSLRNWLPNILIAIGLAVIAFYAYKWYENQQRESRQQVYLSFDQLKNNQDITTKQALFDKFIIENPKSEFIVFAAVNLAAVYIEQQQYQQSLDVLNKVQNLPGSKSNIDRLSLAQARVAYQLTNYDDAINFIAKIPVSSSFYNNAQLLHGDILVTKGNNTQAVLVWKELKTKINSETDNDNDSKTNLIRILDLRINTH